MECLFHEKPFAGVNGSGKHVNFSLGNSELGSLLVPGDTPHENAQFLVFCAAVIRAVHKFAGLLRVSVASATNDHRWAPTRHRRRSSRFSSGNSSPTCSSRSPRAQPRRQRVRAPCSLVSIRCRNCRPIRATATAPARSRSPGNRFEFRAPGSLQTVAVPLIIINTIMADSLDYLATKLEAAVADGEDFDKAVQTLLTEVITEHGDVVYNGDGYSEKWQIEAAERGLPNLKTTLDAVGELIKPEAIELFEKYSVFSARELHSRYEVQLEQYVLTVAVEAKLSLEIATTVILPAAVRYQTELAQNVAALKAAGVEASTIALDAVSGPISELTAALGTLKTALAHHAGESAFDEAKHAQDELLPAMAAVRAAADTLESVVADDLWPLPTYQEMLYIL